jgi:hypothetical protein
VASRARGRSVGALSVSVSVALLAGSAPSAAAPKRITGKLSKPGYTVIALAADGKAKAVRATKGKFRLRPPAELVTLHLRKPNGIYAGPIVVGHKRKGRRAIVGVKAGARLGGIKVRRGYAKVSKRRREEWIDASRLARARKAIPIGARVFGQVRSRPPGSPIPGDRDFDGIPDPLDIDDDGDLILDDVDRSTAAQAAQTDPPPPPPPLSVLPYLALGLQQTANANHPALAAQIDRALSGSGALILGVANPFGGSAELDCAGDPAAVPPRPGLVYCSRGGTGRLYTPARPSFPQCCDGDNDGFGTVPPFSGLPQLVHGARSDQIKTGDVLIGRFNDAGGAEVGAFSQLLPYVFATTPALVAYHDSAVPPNQLTLSYPYAPGAVPEFPVDAGPNGDVVVTLTLWRPQRRRIANDPKPKAGESAQWTDIGGLNYTAGLGAGECPRSALSETDPNLIVSGNPALGAAPGLTDSRSDQPANPNETLTFTLNITQCLESQGIGGSFDESGEGRIFHLVAGGGGRADQTMSFKRE